MSEYIQSPDKRDHLLLWSDHEESKARRVIRTNNFTQQTNALDVDKHM